MAILYIYIYICMYVYMYEGLKLWPCFIYYKNKKIKTLIFDLPDNWINFEEELFFVTLTHLSLKNEKVHIKRKGHKCIN